MIRSTCLIKENVPKKEKKVQQRDKNGIKKVEKERKSIRKRGKKNRSITYLNLFLLLIIFLNTINYDFKRQYNW